MTQKQTLKENNWKNVSNKTRSHFTLTAKVRKTNTMRFNGGKGLFGY